MKRVVPSSLRGTAGDTACQRCSVKPISPNFRSFKAQPARNSHPKASPKSSAAAVPRRRDRRGHAGRFRASAIDALFRQVQEYRLELGGCSACCNDGCVNITPALTEEATATIRKDCRNFGNDCECDFFGGLAADVESRRSVQVSGPGFEIKRSIFAQPRQ